jgi:hypothetical protein
VALEYGSLLHRRAYGVFTALLLKMGLPDPPPDAEDIRLGRREKGINALGVYALGFMTHVFLDRHCHPYIVYKSQYPDPERRAEFRGGLGRGAHPFFERIIDVLMLQRLRGQDAAAWDQGMLAGILENPPLGLEELLGRALKAGFPERAGKDRKLAQRMANAFLDAAWFYRLTDPRHAPASGIDRLLVYLYPARLSPDIDFLNLNHEAWYDPGGASDDPGAEADTRSFPEIYAGALTAAADALAPGMAGYLETGDFPIADAARRIGNGGLSIQDENGKPCAPRRTSPLPLERVWREQAALRG